MRYFGRRFPLTPWTAWRVAFVVGGGVMACSASSAPTRFGTGGQTTATTGTPTTSGAGGTTNTSTGTGNAAGVGGGIVLEAGTTDGSDNNGCNVTDQNADMDGDGWTPAEGDCNDCDPNVNPGAIDVLHTPDGGMPFWGNEDCANKPGPPPTCDDNLAVDDVDPIHGANAIEICKILTNPKGWGLKSASWVLPDGSPPSALMPTFSMSMALANYDLGHGMLSAFGPNVNVQAGKRMLGLSSGTARQPTDPGYMDVSGFDKGYTTNSPVGFPKESPACPGVITGQPHDGVGLELQIVAPTNAHGFSFNFNFFTYEWPGWVCSMYNDFFVALLMPFPMGQTDGNISFDSMGNPVSVNNAFLEVCGCGTPPPCNAGGKMFTCSLGDMALLGTGFGMDTAGSDHGSTYWLETKAPVQPHESLTLRFAVYDSGDGVLDTTGIVDNFQWIASPGVVVGTQQQMQPK
jgi:hypothetical protein